MELATEVELLKQQVEQHDESLDRFGDIAATLREIIIEHKEKFKRADEVHNDLKINTAGRFEVLKEDLQKDIKNATDKLSAQMDEMIKNQNELVTSFKDTIKDFGMRIRSLERYKWIIFGGATALGFLVKFAIDLVEPVHEIIKASPH
jgi:hypothetical protein